MREDRINNKKLADKSDIFGISEVVLEESEGCQID